MKLYLNKLVVFSLLFFNGSTVIAQQKLEMEGTAIIGNKELPKVLYIVPWKSAEQISLNTPPYSSVLDQALQPIDRATFKRQVKYYNELYSPLESKP